MSAGILPEERRPPGDSAFARLRGRRSVRIAHLAEPPDRVAQHGDRGGDLAAIELHLRLAIRHAVHRGVVLEPVALEFQPFDELVDLRAQNIGQIALSQIAATLRTMNDGIALGSDW